jgi:hypothetical protein
MAPALSAPVADWASLNQWPLSTLPLEGCSVSALVRGGRRHLEWPADLAVEAGDTLVLSGTVEQVGSAEARLLRMGAPGRS